MPDQIWGIAAKNNISFRVSHILDRDNVVADVLSRLHLGQDYVNKLSKLKAEHNPIMLQVKEDYLSLQDWSISMI